MARTMTTQTCHPASHRQTSTCNRPTEALAYASHGRQIPRHSPKLKPASQSYLHRDSQAVIIGIIFAMAGILLTAKVWLIKLLG
jgi:hypothetical protein